jgi:murein DD-endopeptidase MepM/ murein hydrolase activator NlpD
MFKIIFLILLPLCIWSQSISTYAKKNGKDIEIYMKNTNIFDVTFKYNATYKGLSPLRVLPIVDVINSKSDKLLSRFKITDRKYSLKGKYSWVIGNKNVKHNDKYLYRLPYKKGTSHIVTQGFNGLFSHKGESKYAVDFNLKIGDKIYASRDGIVVMAKSDGKQGGVLKKFYKDANFITIEHDDGTLGKYNHLAFGGVKVKIGQRVKRGEFIGISGNTGYTNGAHLHFIVYKPKDEKSREPIPIKFISKEGVVTYTKRGMKLTAVE